ncbi:MAG: molecular chaperone DnaJ [Leptolyngbyaceae cyanobacterium RU_5_1]|nr:molecular chaperone DnaJ [Leptolyngbyaceae cyanobacterium RU_5_1]
MSEQNPYEQLGVTENSSFDEIQAARNRLFAEFKGDSKQLEKLEAAYDAVLMERLRMRQEGKIKVPDRIRFPEKLAEPAPSSTPTLVNRSPAWLQRFIDTPSRSDILLPGGIMAALIVLIIVTPPTSVQIALPLAVASTLYFLYRKEQKLGRTVLLSFAGLIAGILVGGLLYNALRTSINLSVGVDVFASIFTFVLLWLISSFLR